jgi:large conductance mechanosensitive channel
MSGFRKFLMRGNIIDLAVAVVMGVAFNAIVQALVKDLITPLITAITQDHIDFGSLAWHLGTAKLTYGAVINAAVSFLVIAAVVYWLIVAPTEKMIALTNRNKAATDRPCPECLSTIPVAAKRCMYCTSEVPPAPTPSVTTPARRPRRRLWRVLRAALLSLWQRARTLAAWSVRRHKRQPDDGAEA